MQKLRATIFIRRSRVRPIIVLAAAGLLFLSLPLYTQNDLDPTPPNNSELTPGDNNNPQPDDNTTPSEAAPPTEAAPTAPPLLETPPPNSSASTPKASPKRTTPIVASQSLPPSYVLEVEVGINLFGYNTDDVISRYNFDNISDTVALSFNFKPGFIYANHWKSLFIFGYSKRPNYEYPRNYLRAEDSLLEVHRHYRLGLEQQYLIGDYFNRVNLGFGLEGSWLRRSIEVNERSSRNDQTFSITRPETFRWDEFVIAPKLKFFYRISRYGLLHFSIEYLFPIPSFEHHVQFLLGIDISFFLFNPAKNAKFPDYPKVKTDTGPEAGKQTNPFIRLP